MKTTKHGEVARVAGRRIVEALLPMVAVAWAALSAGPVSASEPLRISPLFGAEGGVHSYGATPDSQWIHYTSHEDAQPSSTSLWAVPRGGGTPIRLSGPSAATSVIDILGYTADGSQLVWADLYGATQSIHGSPVGGPEAAAVLLEDSFPPGHRLWEWSIVGDHLVYAIYDQVTRVGGTFVVPVAGPASAARRIGGPTKSPIWRPAEALGRIVYQDDGELFSVGVSAGSVPVSLDDALPYGWEVRAFLFSPDRSRVVVIAEETASGNRRLYAVPSAGPGSAGVELTTALPAGESLPLSVSIFDYQFSADGSRLVVVTDVEGNFGTLGPLYSASLTGASSALVRLDDTEDGVQRFAVSPNGERVVYRALNEAEDRQDLFLVAGDGSFSSAVRLSDTAHSVDDFRIADDAETVVYRTEVDEARGSDVPELYRLKLSSPATTLQRLSGVGPSERIAVAWFGKQVGKRWIYSGQAETASTVGLYSVLLDGNRARTTSRLDLESPSGTHFDIDVAAGGEWLIYTEHSDPRVTMMVPVDGSEEAVPVHGYLPPWFETRDAEVLPDGDSFLYTLSADEISPTGATLYLQRIPEIFRDGFETGDASAWQ